MAKILIGVALLALVVVALAVEPVKKVQLTDGSDLKTASSFGGYGLGFGYGGYGGWGGWGGWGWGLPVYGWGWGGLGHLGYGGYGGYGFYG